MQLTATAQHLWAILERELEEETANWIQAKVNTILSESSAKDLYLTYTLLATKIPADQGLSLSSGNDSVQAYLESHNASALEIARIFLLSRVLEENQEFFTPKVANLIQLADTGELVTFLRYLVLLPDAGAFRQVAVDALRTNIATVFDAISLDNPYPSLYFNDQQWNQMYLKAAFMQRDLGKIRDVDKRANKDLARIISDYAHERWAASREIDPMFWRPVSQFLEGGLLDDMKRMLRSTNATENRAAALCCYLSDKDEAAELLKGYPELLESCQAGRINWNTLIV